MKRFTDTDIWKKRWFRILKSQYKTAWFYIKDNCDSVGVWNVDFELANFQIGSEIDWVDFADKCNGNIHILSKNKWWLVDFCRFQYSTLSEESASKPIISYISLLKKHRLWEDYTSSLYSIQEKDKEKEQDKEQEKEKDRKPIYLVLAKLLYSLHKEQDNKYSKTESELKKWANDIRLLSEKDNREVDLIEKVVRWAKKPDCFWFPNIQSGYKLRKQFDTMLAQMKQSTPKTKEFDASIFDEKVDY